MKKRRGFTLVELVIAIIVIAMLIGGVVVGTGTLVKDAKVNNIVDFVSRIQSSVEMAKLKCSMILNDANITNAQQLAQDLTNAQCGVWDRTPPLDSNNRFIVSGVPVNTAYDITNGRLTITIFQVGDIADKLVSAMQVKYGAGVCQVNSNNVICTFN